MWCLAETQLLELQIIIKYRERERERERETERERERERERESMSKPESQNNNSIRFIILTLDVTVRDTTKLENGVMLMQLLGFDNCIYLYVFLQTLGTFV